MEKELIMSIKNNLPNLFTMANLGFGVLAIINMFNEEFFLAALLILLSGLLDRFDGMLARKLNATSNLGKELDSLSDLISFGIAPALLVWNIALNELKLVGAVITVFYAVCGAYRLARYNVTKFEGVYVGIPITIAGGILSIISLLTIHYELVEYSIQGIPKFVLVIGVIVIILSYSMVSTKLRLRKR